MLRLDSSNTIFVAELLLRHVAQHVAPPGEPLPLDWAVPGEVRQEDNLELRHNEVGWTARCCLC